MAMMKIKKGDTVKVIAGKDNGKEGKVVSVDQKNSKSEGLGVNFVFVPRIRSGIKVVKMDFLLLLIIARTRGTVNCL